MNRIDRAAWAACCALLCAVLLFTGFAVPAEAGVEIYRDGEKYVEVGGVIQLQYDAFDPADGDGEDDVRFRRLRPYVEASLTDDWLGKIEVDFGQAIDGNEVAVKDAYIRWTGGDHVLVTVGNQKPPFSREFLTSSKRQQLVERTFTGDHNYGSPDRMAGVRL
ncbi:MAG TPA: porin, partial [Thermoanaerobaculia bacterium]|nr:porin [Thermoanaerobaculia bacterium]